MDMDECFICKNPNSKEIGIGATRMYVYRCPFCGEYGLAACRTFFQRPYSMKIV
jgi:hypothetical protein